jgi:hypothetical protein
MAGKRKGTSKRVASEAGQEMHSPDKEVRSVAAAALAETKRRRKRNAKRASRK